MGCHEAYIYYNPILKEVNVFFEKKWTLKDLNLGPADYESDALTN